MHRLLSKLMSATDETRRAPEPRRPSASAPPAMRPRPRRSLNEAAHKRHH
jgi:hypothetical protein